MDEQLEFVKLITTRLESAGIPYMLTGSMAMSFYAIPRMTRDIDLVANLDDVSPGRIVELFSGDCYVDEEAVRYAISRRDMFNIIHNDWIVKADFVVRKDSAYRIEEFKRKKRKRLRGIEVDVVSAEDLNN